MAGNVISGARTVCRYAATLSRPPKKPARHTMPTALTLGINTCLVGTVVVARPPTARPTRTSWPLSPNPSARVATPSSPFSFLLPPPLIATKRVSRRSPPRESETFTAIRSRRIRTNHGDHAQPRLPPAPSRETFLRSYSLRSSSSFPSLDLLDCQGSRGQPRGRYCPAPSFRSPVFRSLVTPRRPYRRRRHSSFVFGFLFPTRRSPSR